MITLRELRINLTPTQEDIGGSLTEDNRRLMSQTPNAGFEVGSEYAFQCVSCQAAGVPSIYALVKEQFGPGSLGRKTDVKKITAVKGIMRLDDLGFEPGFSSTLHVTKEGNVCSHCYDTVYAEE